MAGELTSTVNVWDLTTGQVVGAPFTAEGPIARMEFLPNGSAVVVSTAASATRVPTDGTAPSVLANCE